MLKRGYISNLEPKLQSFPHQAQALSAIKEMDYSAVFHEQGLGKTKIGLDLALVWLEAGVVDSVLVVTKKGLLENWFNEISIHTHIRPSILTQDRKKNFYLFNSPIEIYLCHYEVLNSEKSRLELFLKTRKVGIILDESHKIKNPNSRITQALFDLSHGFEKKCIMTGTPIANRPYDLWSQVYFLDKGESLGEDFDSFKSSIDLTKDIAVSQEKRDCFEDSLSLLFDKIKPFSVRETKLSSSLVLPNKEVRNVCVEMKGKQASLYSVFESDISVEIEKSGKTVFDDVNAVLKRLMRLVQVASNPLVVDDSYDEVPTKFIRLREILKDVVESGSKAIVWTSFIKNADWLSSSLRDMGAVKVHGKMGINYRNSNLRKFKEQDNCKILVATPASSKEGLTLTQANWCIFYDRSFSLDDYLQAQDRIHRISQEKTCHIVNLIAEESIDEWVDRLLSAKHLAAQLGQGDIGLDSYSEQASYDFADILNKILEHSKEMRKNNNGARRNTDR